LAISGTTPATSQKKPNSAKNWDYTLDIVFEGPSGFVKYKDGHVVVYVADVEPHDYAFVKGLSDCELGGNDYVFNLPASVFDPTPDPNLKNNLNIPWTGGLQIDPAGLTTLRSPFPSPIRSKPHIWTHSGLDKRFLKSGTPYTDYQTSIVRDTKWYAMTLPLPFQTLILVGPNVRL